MSSNLVGCTNLFNKLGYSLCAAECLAEARRKHKEPLSIKVDNGALAMHDYPESLIPLEFLDLAYDFFYAYKALPKKRPPDWPKYFLACHAIELVLKAFLAACGSSADKLTRGFGHDLKKLLDEAMDKGLEIGALARGELELLNEAHTKFWHRYPKFESKPVFVIDQFEPHIDELFSHVSKSIR